MKESQKRHHYRLLLRVAILAVFGLLIEWLNIFNTSEASDRASAEIFLRLVSSSQTVGKALPDDPIVLVYFNRQALVNLGWTWPPDFHKQAAIFARIVHHKPKVVFYDIGFYQERDGLDDFAETIAESTGVDLKDRKTCLPGNRPPIGDRRIPVLLASLPQASVRTELCQAGAEGVLVNWQSEPNQYPLRGCGIESDDPACPKTAEMKKPPHVEMAATRLWQILCARADRNPDWNCGHDFSEDALLDLTWPARQREDQRLFGLLDCTKPPPGLFGQLGIEIGAWLHLRQREEAFYGCPPELVLPADQITSDEHVDAAIRGKVVIVATDLPGLRDRQPSPVHGLLPGAFTHAAALDNLLRYRAPFVRRGDYFAFGSEDNFWLKQTAYFFMLVIALSLTFLVTKKIEQRHSLRDVAFFAHFRGRILLGHFAGHALLRAAVSLAAVIGLIVLVVALTLLAAAGFFFALHWPPINWSGIAALTVALALDEIWPAFGIPLLLMLQFIWPIRRLTRFLMPPPQAREGDTDA